MKILSITPITGAGNIKDSKILWILDKEGDIILRNIILPVTCK